jgi:small subunit ribosomal protein S1
VLSRTAPQVSLNHNSTAWKDRCIVAETNEWLEGYETQREKWEKQYAEAHARWEAHKAQVEEATKADAEAAANAGAATSYSSDSGSSSSDSDSGSRPAAPVSEGTLASDEALAALREKLTGN